MKKLKKEDVVEQLATGQMSLRQFNQSLMALGATMVMMPMGSRSAFAGSDDHPTVFTWEGWMYRNCISPTCQTRRIPQHGHFR